MEETKGTICGQCSKPSETKCSRCKTIYYCGRECQKKHWPIHKKCCKTTPTEGQQDKSSIEPEGEEVSTDGVAFAVKVSNSSIHGRGVFATKSIHMGDKICFFHGQSKDCNIVVRMRQCKETGIMSIKESEKVFYDHIKEGNNYYYFHFILTN